LLLAATFLVVMTGYFAFIRWVGVPIIRMTAIYTKAGWSPWAMVALISLAPAVFEELGFRGVIQSGLMKVVSEREAWLIQAALFSVLHLLPLMFPSHFLMGLCFGYLRLRSKSLYPGMALHASWNALVLLQELHGW
jgi:membrane protease YdiL (CAAX protease family)